MALAEPGELTTTIRLLGSTVNSPDPGHFRKIWNFRQFSQGVKKCGLSRLNASPRLAKFFAFSVLSGRFGPGCWNTPARFLTLTEADPETPGSAEG